MVWFSLKGIGQYYYFLSCIELKSRQSWAKRVSTLSSSNTKVFLEEIIDAVEYSIHTIQTDNGSEFKGYFDQAIEELEHTQHVWSFPKSPKTNGYIERFNWTIQDEFINYEIDTAVCDIKSFDKKLTDWMVYYNQIRPHQSLGYMTPQQYLVQLQKGWASLCQMSVTRTLQCFNSLFCVIISLVRPPPGKR